MHLFDDWGRVSRRLARAKRRVLLTDFDGTLVRIHRDRGRPLLDDPTRRLLRRIRANGAVVGVVSGRGLADARRRVRIPGLWYSGAHGFFLADPGNRISCQLNPTERKRIRRAWRRLRSPLRMLPGIELEWKEATLAVHYRNASAARRRLAERAVRAELAREPGLSLLSGRKVWEVIPGRRVDKWAAVQRILRRAAHGPRRAGVAIFFLGDDQTDEAVFKRLRGTTIVVGRRERTAARYFLRSPREVSRLLERWIEATT